MKIAVISDIHGNGAAFRRVLEDCRKQGVDQYYFLGDYITDGPDVNEILDCIRSLPGVAILGNREEYMLMYREDQTDRWKHQLQYQGLHYTYHQIRPDNMEYLARLPIASLQKEEGVSILLYHGIPSKTRQVFIPAREPDLARSIIREYGADIYIGGHNHVPFSFELDGYRFLNPGSAGIPIRSNGLCYGILMINDGIWDWEQIVLPYDHETLIEELKKQNEHYLKKAGFWSELYFDAIRENRDVVYDFLTLAYQIAGIETKYGETNDIDNDSFRKAMDLWKQKRLSNQR